MRYTHEITLIFPHQLFSNHPALNKDRTVVLLEHPHFFTAFSFHKKKLILHRASMKAYQAVLERRDYTVVYKDFTNARELWEKLKNKTVHYCDPHDHSLETKLEHHAKKHNLELHQYDTPSFMTSKKDIQKKLGNKKEYALRPFYIWQRKRFTILLNKDGSPQGGAWSFDKHNREPLDSDITIPKVYKPRRNKFEREAINYVNKHFAKNPGTTEDFFYPTTDYTAKKWLDNFLHKRLKQFGTYQDAIVKDEPFLFHSVLSPVMNIGLLTPAYIIEKTLAYANKKSIPINSLEGFIRQIIGWREFIRGVYLVTKGSQKQKNFFNHTRRLPQSFWTASTGITPVDAAIHRVVRYGYTHHIERLMVLANFMLLCTIDPDDVYRWFMELFIDAYDWVMVPNVYGMGLYADGGLMTTKPYISSSNYILKMSDYRKNNWCTIWTALYWHFIATNTKIFSSIGRLKIMVGYLKGMKKETLEQHKKTAQAFLENLS